MTQGDDLPFPEPAKPCDAALQLADPLVHWFTKITRPTARLSRQNVNSWYSNSAVRRDPNFLKRLRSEDNRVHQPALDELLVDSLLLKFGDARYEQEGGYPDFTLYRGDAMYAALEVVSLFEPKSEEVVKDRFLHFANLVNGRFECSTHFVSLDTEVIERAPSARKFVRFLESALRDIRKSGNDYPGAEHAYVYSEPGVKVTAQFIRYTNLPPDGKNPIVVGPAAGKWITTGQRLADALRVKNLARYPAVSECPYAIVAFLHDEFWSYDQIERAMFGTAAVRIVDQQWTRMSDGLFKYHGNGNFNRPGIGAVFVVPPWSPGRTDTPVVLRVDNPKPALVFPDILAPSHRVRRYDRSDGSILMDWDPPLPRLGVTLE